MPSLDEVNAKLDELLTLVRGLVNAQRAPTWSASAAPATGELADDADLDGKYGNEAVRKDPPKWLKDGGASYVGRRLSECPPEYLDAVAAFADWKVGKDQQKGDEQSMKNAGYAKRDAARARGWAARIRSGKVPMPDAAAATGGASSGGARDDFFEGPPRTDDDIPF